MIRVTSIGHTVLATLYEAARPMPERPTCGSQGNGQIAHLTFEMLQLVSGARLTHVPYRGSAPLVTTLLEREVNVSANTLITVGEHIRAGTMKLIAITGTKRVPAYPAVPTVAKRCPVSFRIPGQRSERPQALRPRSVGTSRPRLAERCTAGSSEGACWRLRRSH